MVYSNNAYIQYNNNVHIQYINNVHIQYINNVHIQLLWLIKKISIIQKASFELK